MSARRDQQLHFRVSKTELDRIHVKMAELGIVSIGAYLRKMALDGYCIRLNLKELNRMAYLLQNGPTRAAGSIGQTWMIYGRGWMN